MITASHGGRVLALPRWELYAMRGRDIHANCRPMPRLLGINAEPVAQTAEVSVAQEEDIHGA